MGSFTRRVVGILPGHVFLPRHVLRLERLGQFWLVQGAVLLFGFRLLGCWASAGQCPAAGPSCHSQEDCCPRRGGRGLGSPPQEAWGRLCAEAQRRAPHSPCSWSLSPLRGRVLLGP